MNNKLKSLKKGLIWFLTGLLCTLCCLVIKSSTSIAITPHHFLVNRDNNPSKHLEISYLPLTNAEQLYQAGKYAQAAQVLETALQTYQSQGDKLKQAITLSNLSLVYQQLGNWSKSETAINQSLNLLATQNSSSALEIFAQTLNRRGNLEYTQGNLAQALSTWQQTEDAYRNLDNTSGKINSVINQAQALQSLGFYRRALDKLNLAQAHLVQQPDSVTKATSWRFLGNVLRSSGDFEQSKTALQKSLAIAQQLQSPQQISAALLALGNTARIQQQEEEALNFYQQAAQLSTSPMQKVQAQINQLSLSRKQSNNGKLIEQIKLHLQKLPPSRQSIYAQINFAKTLMEMGKKNSQESADNILIARYLNQGKQQAHDLGDLRAESDAIGTLGYLYEQNQQLSSAQQLTQQALSISATINAPDLSYLWQWQLGRLLQQQGDDDSAIAAYETAINLLKSLRSDLVSANNELQFSFREKVEPVYRELVSLLLKESGNKTSQQKLEQARKVIESLQLAELDNFFRSACLDATPVAIEEVDQQAAVIYPIILPDRLEVIVRIPQQPLRHYATKVTPEEVENTAKNLRRTITNSRRQQFKPYVEQLYDWLIRPAQEDLAQSNVQTLVFILDGVLRNVPIAALYDGQEYLAQKYGVAVTPGLELLESKPLERGKLKVLTAGLSQARQGFNALPGVETELSQIQTQVNTQVLLNEEFLESNVQGTMDAADFPIVHFATHGKFSSKAEDTFVLTWDGQINVNELNGLLRRGELGSDEPIELLVFSACETATGDSRAALGIAGVAVRAGARSTMATLWSVNDLATSQLMVRFYQELGDPQVTKAEALRRAQLSILNDPKYRQHPYFWAPFILVGNWL